MDLALLDTDILPAQREYVRMVHDSGDALLGVAAQELPVPEVD